MLKAVVDSTLFVSGLIARGVPYAVVDAWRRQFFVLLLSDAQRAELYAVLSRPRITSRYLLPAEVEDFLYALDTLALPAPLRLPLPVTASDPNDEHIVAAALGGQADYLVSGDVRHILPLAGDPRLGALRILTARDFITLLQRDFAYVIPPEVR